MKILLSNLGYARGISGELGHHFKYGHRHFYCPPDVQKKSLQLLRDIVTKEDPDICCFVEIDKGSFTSGGFNQLEELLDAKYPVFDIENKYAPNSNLRKFFITRGKSNAFMSKHEFSHEKIYFTQGTKRLIYKIYLDNNTTLFFAHFSLTKRIRTAQILEVKQLMNKEQGQVIFLGDFNILNGLSELSPLLKETSFTLLNREADHTFTFHKRKLVLDLCICSKTLIGNAELKVIPQPFSDHAALLLSMS